MDLGSVLAFVKDVGIPAGVLVWIGWFVQTRVWPDFVTMQHEQSHALEAMADAVIQLTSKMKN